MTDHLLPEYERELAILRRSMAEFAKRHPKAAARLAIAGEHSEDPHVERLLQSAAFLYARASTRINDDYPEFTTALLELVYPEYLRPFPSCSIAHFAGTDTVAKLASPAVIERGAELKTRTGEYTFRTAYDVVFSPLRITEARYTLPSSAPAKARLRERTTGILSITLALPAATTAIPPRARVFIDGNRRTVAATLDTLLLRATSAQVEADSTGQWLALDAVPFSPAGFRDDEALIERNASAQSQFRLLLEYFAFPEKFDFVDIDIAALLKITGPCRQVTIHLPIEDLPYDSSPARALATLSAANFRLHCTPVINLFECPAEPVLLKEVDTAVYPVVPQTLLTSDASVYWIDEVRLKERDTKEANITTIQPYYSLPHLGTQQAIYWHAERGGRLAELVSGRDMLLTLVDERGSTVEVDAHQIEADLRCTNGNFPAALETGDPRGDFAYAQSAISGRIAMLCSPTTSTVRPHKPRQMWDMIGMMPANATALMENGLPTFKALLELHLPAHTSGAQRHIDGIAGLACELALEWLPMEPQPMLARGIRVRVSIDDAALEDCAISTLAHAFESVLRVYAPTNSFVQVSLTSAHTGATLMLGEPLPGKTPLI
ncbi:type VI secretion system baseplate subunit TssF [Trinickia caryophylli]|uniref:Type VI secretion system protein ImpG n=1 Tax=Trinickia caryophylli TaxID=28094 RepID=A0A1X7H603_TRICW|nr:type VI secretion system baseplate subunit TssF [Trinickia caryophylli]TRX19192.1 type VI secretion system baseplate subunit TssF [Trinickia caryophylli]WQE13509.1 type VI secretion system baseplate subunit TssF [Trinickia caryophylli]SMF80166.1 type VI secretion system protein ImpG [Trinickia caryophylli]